MNVGEVRKEGGRGEEKGGGASDTRERREEEEEGWREQEEEEGARSCRCIVQRKGAAAGRQMNPAGIWYTPEIAYRSRSQYSGRPERGLRIF